MTHLQINHRNEITSQLEPCLAGPESDLNCEVPLYPLVQYHRVRSRCSHQPDIQALFSITLSASSAQDSVELALGCLYPLWISPSTQCFSSRTLSRYSSGPARSFFSLGSSAVQSSININSKCGGCIPYYFGSTNNQ